VDRSLIDSFAPSCLTAADLYKQVTTLWSVTTKGCADMYFSQLSTIKKNKTETVMAFFTRIRPINLLKAAKQEATAQQQLTFFMKTFPPSFDTLLTVIRMTGITDVECILPHLI
jgi:hypothetical protein